MNLNRPCVLLCEDEPAQLRLPEEAFEEAGYAPIGARSPHDGVRLARGRSVADVVSDIQLEEGNAFELLAKERSFDIALVDMHTPPPGGAALVRAIRAADPALSVAIVTGEAAFVRKPFDAGRLVGIVRGEIGKTRSARAERRPPPAGSRA